MIPRISVSTPTTSVDCHELANIQEAGDGAARCSDGDVAA